MLVKKGASLNRRYKHSQLCFARSLNARWPHKTGRIIILWNWAIEIYSEGLIVERTRCINPEGPISIYTQVLAALLLYMPSCLVKCPESLSRSATRRRDMRVYNLDAWQIRSITTAVIHSTRQEFVRARQVPIVLVIYKYLCIFWGGARNVCVSVNMVVITLSARRHAFCG